MAGDYQKPEAPPAPSKGEYDPYTLPDFDKEFISSDDLDAFARALAAPEAAPAAVTALNDWRPVYQKVRRKSRPHRKAQQRSTDETREGFVYILLKYPLLFVVFGWIVFLFNAYNVTRLYIYAYEHFVSWTGRREKLRRQLQAARNYDEWVDHAKKLDAFLSNDSWKTHSEYAYYDYKTVRRVAAQLADLNSKVEAEARGERNGIGGPRPIEELKSLLENCIKNNFVGVESSRLYSETYYGTKELVQDFIDRVEQGLKTVLNSTQNTEADKAAFFKHLELNYGRQHPAFSAAPPLPTITS